MVGGALRVKRFASLFRLLLTITNCLDLDQARLENAGPDVDPNCLTLLLARLSRFSLVSKTHLEASGLLRVKSSYKV